MLNFVSKNDPVELRQLSEVVRSFSSRTIDPARGASVEFTPEYFRGMSMIGLPAMALSESAGGVGFGQLAIASALFEVARAQCGPAVVLSVHLMVSRLIERWGCPELVKSVAPQLATANALAAFCLTEARAGSDAAALECRAKRVEGGYVLSGEKIYITSGGVADLYLVFARTGGEGRNGISAFVVEKDRPGLSFGPPEKKMGCEGSPISSVRLEGCVIPESNRLGAEGEGLSIALSGLRRGRVSIAAVACGIASRAIEIARDHALTRVQFGESIARFQGVQFLFADMVQKLRASIALTREAAVALDLGEEAEAESSIAKCFASDAAMEITTNGVQLLGGAGYLRDYHVERLMRDAKMLQIVEGTNEIQRLVIARALLGKELRGDKRRNI